MGIFCEMTVVKPANGIYQPGQVVSGVIKYAVDQPMEVEKITTSLEGIGCLEIKVSTAEGTGQKETLYRTNEVYVDINAIIQNERVNIPIGSYEIQFNYILPQHLPSTMSFSKRFKGKDVKCYIKYLMQIKFERPGIFAFNKCFRKEINVKSTVVPKLFREPVIYGERMKLMHFFSSKESIVNIKATVPNSVLQFGGKIIVHYEVENKSQVLVNFVISKLVEVHIFMSQNYGNVMYEEDVPGTETRRMSINCNYTQKATVDINIPHNVYNIENNLIVSRYYSIKIIAQLPIPHRNVILDIPVQIGVIYENVNETVSGHYMNAVGSNSADDAPPSYWEAMGEYDDKPIK